MNEAEKTAARATYLRAVREYTGACGRFTPVFADVSGRWDAMLREHPTEWAEHLAAVAAYGRACSALEAALPDPADRSVAAFVADAEAAA